MSHLISDSRISQAPFDPFSPTPTQAEAMDRLAQQGYDPWPDALINHPQFVADMNAREQELAERMGLSAHAGSIHGHDVLFIECPSETRDSDDSDADLVDDWHAYHDAISEGWEEQERDDAAYLKAKAMVERIADAEVEEWREQCDREAAEMGVV